MYDNSVSSRLLKGKTRSKLGCGSFAIICAAIGLFVLIAIALLSGGRNTSLKIDKSPKTQAARKEVINGLIAEEVFDRIEPRKVAVAVWVRPRFYLLEFKQKQLFLDTVFSYYLSDSGSWLEIIDNNSGKKVGEFTIRGLNMY